MQITESDAGLSTTEVVGIALSSITLLSAGLLVALVIAYCYIRRLNEHSPKDTQQPAPMYENITVTVATSKDIELQEQVYAEVSEITSRDINLKENVAYGVI